VVHRLVKAGAATNRFYPAHRATPSDWAKPEEGDTSDASFMLYNMFIVHRITGLMLAPGGTADHVQVERPMLAEAEATGLSAAELRERGNWLVQSKEWAQACRAYSLSLVLALKRLGSAADRMEAAKVAANRSFVYLKMAKESQMADPLAANALEENAALMLHVAEAKERRSGGMYEDFITPPDLMQLLGEGTMEEAVEAGRLEPWRMFAVLAFADADRANTLAPQWSKPIARQAEAARFLATQSARRGDEHGLSAMSTLSGSTRRRRPGSNHPLPRRRTRTSTGT
jgi:hypothetical protein